MYDSKTGIIETHVGKWVAYKNGDYAYKNGDHWYKIFFSILIIFLFCSCSDDSKESKNLGSLEDVVLNSQTKIFWDDHGTFFKLLKTHRRALGCHYSYLSNRIGDIQPVVPKDSCDSNRCSVHFVGSYVVAVDSQCLASPGRDYISLNYNPDNLELYCDFMKHEKGANNESVLVLTREGLCLFSALKSVGLDYASKEYRFGVFNVEKNGGYVASVFTASGPDWNLRGKNRLGLIFHSCQESSCKLSLFNIDENGRFSFLRETSKIKVQSKCRNILYSTIDDPTHISVGVVNVLSGGSCSLSVSYNGAKAIIRLENIRSTADLPYHSRIVNF